MMIVDSAVNPERSPFSLDIIELVIAIGVSVFTWLVLRSILWTSEPFGGLHEPLPQWFIDGRQELFSNFAIPWAITIGISAIFLLRGTLNQKIRYFTRMSHLAVAFPMILFIVVNSLSFLSLYCLPIGVIFAFIGFGIEIKTASKWGWLAAFIWNIICLIFASIYFGQWWLVYGD